MDKFFRKYVWDDERTPYLVSVGRLSQRQIGYELRFYAVFSGGPFGLVSIASLSSSLPHGDARGVSLYAFTQVCAALLLGATRSAWAAMYCASAPLAVLLYFGLFGFHPNLGPGDKALLMLAAMAWVVYGGRLIAIARAHPNAAGR